MISVIGKLANFDSSKAMIVAPEPDKPGVKLYANGKPFMLDSVLEVNGVPYLLLRPCWFGKRG